MTSPYACEPLEPRNLFSATPVPGLDPTFVFDLAAIRKIAGKSTSVYDAVPAAGDKTYFVAERQELRLINPNDPSQGMEETGLLTIARVTADGKLDRTFGTNGVALTERYTEPRGPASGESPAILKTDAAGRIYVADNTRVLRLRANGTIDRTFGHRGEAEPFGTRRTMALTDIAPVEDGVYVSTADVTDGVEHFVVQKIDRRVRTVWSAEHDSGLSFVQEHGEGGFDGEPDGKRYTTPYMARFAVGRGGVVLTHVESDYVEDDYTNSYGYSATRQQLVVTRFDASGPAEAARRELRKGVFSETGLRAAFQSGNGRLLFVQTTVDVLRVNLAAGTVRRYDFTVRDSLGRDYQLQPDGAVYAIDTATGYVDYRPAKVERLALDGTRDSSFGDHGVLRLRLTKKGGTKSYLALNNGLFLGASGRPYFLIDAFDAASTSLQRL